MDFETMHAAENANPPEDKLATFNPSIAAPSGEDLANDQEVHGLLEAARHAIRDAGGDLSLANVLLTMSRHPELAAVKNKLRLLATQARMRDVAEDNAAHAQIIDALVAGNEVQFRRPYQEESALPSFSIKVSDGLFIVKNPLGACVGVYADFDVAWSAGAACSQ